MAKTAEELLAGHWTLRHLWVQERWKRAFGSLAENELTKALDAVVGGEVTHVESRATCPQCGMAYWLHPEVPGHYGATWACGELVKL